jgi:sigma-B regulation protein RsbU (phosphoserine phosphatase)
MNSIYLFSCLAAVVFTLPLWYDASTRPEYGKRPRFFLVAILLVALGGVLSVVAIGTMGSNLTQYRENLLPLLLLLYFLAFFILEYSVHQQRIYKSKLINSFKEALARQYVLVGAFSLLWVVAVVLFHFKSGLGLADFMRPGLYANVDTAKAINEAMGAQTLWVTLGRLVMATAFVVAIFNFKLQQGVIRLKIYPFVAGAVLTMVLLLIDPILGNQIVGIELVVFVLFNALFLVRVSHEYFFFRMHHLNDMHRRQGELEATRTELINRILMSRSEEDIAIINQTLTGFLDRLRRVLPNPEHVVKSMMLYRSTGDILAIDKEEFIIDYCIPLQDSDNLKRMGKDDLRQHIMQQTFDIGAIMSHQASAGEDFATALFRAACQKRDGVTADPVPDKIKPLFKTLACRPIFNRDELMGMLVIFKDNFNYVFPQEDVLIRALVDNLSIILAIMEGKRVQEERNRLSGEMDIAQNIQTSVLPRRLDLPGYEAGAVMITASEVGGDLYDYRTTPFGAYINIGDVSGHGLPSGIMALIQLTAFETALETAEHFGKELASSALYDIINRILCAINRDRIGSDKFMTCNVLRENAGTFSHAGAHLTALLYRAKANAVVEQPGMMDRTAFLGLSEHIKSDSSAGSFALEQGDLLVLYTDGAIEAKDSASGLFGIERLKEVVAREATQPVDRIIGAILDKIHEHAASGDKKKYGGKFADDISLVVLRKQ